MGAISRRGPVWLAGMLAVLVSGVAGGAERFAPTDREIAMLPPYCQAKVGSAPAHKAMRPVWEARLGRQVWLHLHHLCFAEVFALRSWRAGANRKLNLQRAYNNYSYVIERWPPGTPLLPAAYLGRGKVRLRQGDVAGGVRDLEQAIRLRPSYPPPYLALAAHYARLGQYGRAVEVVERGLRHAPRSRALRRRLAEYRAKAGRSAAPPAASR